MIAGLGGTYWFLADQERVPSPPPAMEAPRLSFADEPAEPEAEPEAVMDNPVEDVAGAVLEPEPERPTIADPAGEEAAAEPSTVEWREVVADNYANVRSAGSSEAEVVGMVAPGDLLDLEVSDRSWRRVRKGSLTGWVWVPALNLPGTS